MTPPLHSESVLRLAPSCVVRRQVDQVLLYNPRTDELHLVPSKGYLVVELCDGLTTIREIEERLAGAMPADGGVLGDGLRAFFGALVERGLLEVDDDG